jgi:glutamine amidotransferase
MASSLEPRHRKGHGCESGTTAGEHAAGNQAGDDMTHGTVGVLNYEAGNLTSVETALRHLGAHYLVSSDPEELKRCERLIFPGVGEARAAMRALQSASLDSFLAEYHASGRPLLGICLGCQIVLEASEENATECLGLVAGTSRRFPEDRGLKIPHMGWNSVAITQQHPIFDGIPDESSFYFVHSYYPQLQDRSLELGSTEYGISFSSAFARDNLCAVQFHPEKSGPRGLQLLTNFLSMEGGS